MAPICPNKKKKSDPALLEYGTAEWTEKLIESVFEHQALYNHSHADYRNLALRDIIWESIAVSLQTSAEDVKKRWRSLRDTYSRIIRNRVKKNLPERGSAIRWMWAEKMEPLSVYLTSAAHNEGMDSSSLLEVWLDDDKSESGRRYKIEPPDYEDDSRTHGTEDSTTPEDGAQRTPEFTAAASSTGKRPLLDMDYFDDDKRAKMDPIDLLFLAHASTIKTFSPRRQAITKMKIAKVIMHEELNHHEEWKPVKTNEGTVA